IVGQAPIEDHWRMRMRVDEAWKNDLIGGVNDFPYGVLRQNLIAAADLDDGLAVDSYGAGRQHLARSVAGDNILTDHDERGSRAARLTRHEREREAEREM